ncbi:DUF5682 family protein [Paenibacillus sp. J5C_2022]|uniref:DUF5682 family protein n=1 Tax=Paenibacillus sp. J5C2022 TaxID=2977129 RepID=UPI0021CE16B5|nr:DUF5682 family protein [Paenibacillus sp. J5C2022]MCU6711884.1 DUF5682 family protein [Paenibacillus sp. J5C2022]
MESAVHIFGVRHLSPGGAKHLLQFLDEMKPTAVLIEGPADATAEIRHLTNKRTKPPVALLAFTDSLPVRTAMWPFAVYSPEFQAMKWAKENGAEAAFIDLPSSVTLALRDKRQGGEADGVEADDAEAAEEADSTSGDGRDDGATDGRAGDGKSDGEPEGSAIGSIYERIAELAGEHDYDMYWERHYEHNLNSGAYREAILAFSREMRELSEAKERSDQPYEFAHNAIREAYMRREIGKAVQAGHQPDRIVVVCGAYHAAALEHWQDAMTDEEYALLPKRSAKLTLMPYSYYRLSTKSGYGAGNHAPYYYEMMWQHMEQGTLDELPEHYLSRIARRLREEGHHRSTAEVIEAVRLAQSLAALHGGSAPTHRDLRDAAQTLLGRGELSVIAEALAHIDVGTAIGELADGVSQTPIQDDLNRLLKKLKLDKYRTAVAADLALDLRENRRVKSEEAAFLDLNRSTLLHRLALLGISFAKQQASGQENATWAEHWVLRWSPEVEIEVVESTLLGETVEVAAAFKLKGQLESCGSIAEASALIKVACRCGMIAQMEEARSTLQHLAADSRDVVQLAAAARELSTTISYGDLRRIDTAHLLPLMMELFSRACLFLVEGSGCNDEAAHGMTSAMNELNAIASDHYEHIDEELWLQELQELAERDDLNPRLSGFAAAILLERNKMTAEQCAQEVSRRLSPGIPADIGAGWFEGLSLRNRYALLSRMSLWEQLNEYIGSLEDEEFLRALVFLRRAFSSFDPREKTMIAELLGELWGTGAEQTAEALTGELKEDEEEMIDQLNDFDFEDF